jgi:HSP20 family protein
MSQRDPKIWMWAEACELIDRAERIHRQFFQVSAAPRAWEPPVDIYETETELAILVALPGVAPDQLEVAVEAGALIVAGARPLPAALRQARLHRLEIPHGRFERRIELPPGRFALAHQELTNGCLLLGLHKI